MPYSEALAARIRDLLRGRSEIEVRKMFGGVCFLHRGHMLVGVWRDALIARLGPEQAALALQLPHVREMDITGKPMTGWVIVEPEGLDGDDELRHWIDRARLFVGTIPPQSPGKKTR